MIPGFLFSVRALEDFKRENRGSVNRLAFLQLSEIFRQYLLLLTNVIEKRRLVPLSMKVSNNIKKIIGRPAALRHVMRVILRTMLFLLGNPYHTRLYFLECSDSPRVFNFQFPFCSSGEKDFLVSTLIEAFILPSLRFKYLVSVLDMSVN